jgi:hypothetical protein
MLGQNVCGYFIRHSVVLWRFAVCFRLQFLLCSRKLPSIIIGRNIMKSESFMPRGPFTYVSWRGCSLPGGGRPVGQ